ncbi:MAG TPA: hypothetical protein VFU07_07840 [Candidatus Lumbricidophila sp.]|nr:hypothetical protein [Candidatus Lumbricidophila sp.]
MGFTKIEPVASHPPCPVPFITRKWATGEPDFGVGTVWECDTCRRRWELVAIPKRGANGKWVLVTN